MKSFRSQDTLSVEWQRIRGLMARSFVQELRAQGYFPGQVLEICSEIEGLIQGEGSTSGFERPTRRAEDRTTEFSSAMS